MKANIVMSLILAGTLGTAAHAENIEEQNSNTSTAKVGDVQNNSETVKDIDDEITNARLRATTGSKSKWSLSASLNYNGGTVNSPFADKRPALLTSALTETKPALGGSVGAAYRIDANNRLSADTGVSVLSPFHGSSDTVSERTQVDNPSITYSHMRKLMNLQSVSSLALTNYTSKSTRADGVVANRDIGFSQTLLGDLGKTGIQAGLSLSLGNTFYDDGVKDTDTNVAGGRTDYYVGVYPFAEYAFNDRYSLRTVFGYFNYDHYRAETSALEFVENKRYQSFGLGIAVTRDIYLYPNIQFLPEDLQSEATNVALNATINMF